MLSRRKLLIGGLAAGAFWQQRRAGAAAPQPATAVSFEVPAGACDCHTHIFGDPAQFPLSAARTYTPMPALPEEMARLHQALNVQRVVIVTPSAYGTDNAATLFGVQARYPHARGVVVIDDAVTESQLDAMGRAGVCGLRLYLALPGTDPAVARARFTRAVARACRRNWHVQIFARPAILTALHDLIMSSPVPVVIDHFGGAQGDGGLAQPGFAELLELVAAGKAYVKVSAAYRFSARPPDYEDMALLARALISANPQRVLWATDWPHTAGDIPGKKPTDIFPFIDVDDGRLMNLFAAWAPDPAVRSRILVDNPAQLYGF